MYYKSTKRNNIKKWLLGRNSKLYAILLAALCVIAFLVFNSINSFNNGPENNNNDSSAASTSSNVESSVAFVTENESYLIKVNKSNNFMSIYKMDSSKEYTIVFKVLRCSVNPNVSTGTFQINEKFIWRKLDNGVFGQYTSKIGDGIYIHSVPYKNDNNSSLITSAYNKLGSSADIGSIYLTSSDAKWIYENCANKTNIEIYENKSEVPAMGLGEFSTLPNGAIYDPSDLQNSQNIVPIKINYMTGVTDSTIKLNSTFDKWAGVYAVDVEGNDITSYVSISGSVNTSVAGQYRLIYNLQDSLGTVLAYYRYVTVQ